MATNFPTSVDVLTNPVSNDSLNSPSHSAQHTNANDAIEAVESYLLTGAGNAGLVKIIPSSVTNGTLASDGTITIGSAVSSVIVNGVFSSAYENYLVQVTGYGTSANSVLFLRPNGSTGTTYQSAGYLINYGTATLVAVAGALNSNGFRLSENASAGNNSCEVTVFRPFTVTQSSSSSRAQSDTGGSNYATRDTAALSSTDFTLVLSSGTMSFGTIRVYGYK
jgi:hypothetical protein